MTALNKQALRERYSPQQVPKCHICGAEMTVQRMSASRITYGCTGATYDDTGSHYAEGRSIADDHYAQSRVTVVDVSDPEVLALLDELEAKDRRNAELEYLLEDEIKSWMQRYDSANNRREAAEKRIAELEARKVTVKLPADYRNSDGSINDDMFNTCAVVGAFSEALSAAGIGVKGE